MNYSCLMPSPCSRHLRLAPRYWCTTRPTASNWRTVLRAHVIATRRMTRQVPRAGDRRALRGRRERPTGIVLGAPDQAFRSVRIQVAGVGKPARYRLVPRRSTGIIPGLAPATGGGVVAQRPWVGGDASVHVPMASCPRSGAPKSSGFDAAFLRRGFLGDSPM
jgi:hypothetical protein